MDDYTVTFTKPGYKSVVRNITRHDFVNGVATVNVVLGAPELLRGKTASDLANADKWYFDEYRGGRSGGAYPHWDWTVDYMCTLDLWGDWEEQNEGTTLRIRNDATNQSNPADLDVFDSYVYGSKKITNANKILTLQVRTHNAEADDPAHFAVQVIDLSATEPVTTKIGNNKTHGSSDYDSYDFDLSAYVGKEVIVAVGIYRARTGDYWKQLVLSRIAFAPQKAETWNWLPGTEVTGLEGWHLTQEMVRTMMVNPLKSFEGRGPSSDRNNYVNAYRQWREKGNHVATNWFLVPVNKDTEPVAGPYGLYIIKTRGYVPVSTMVPDAFITAKFAITAENDQLTFLTRVYGTDYTYFKLTAIEENLTVTHIEPVSHSADAAAVAADNCWKVLHERGDGNGTDNDSFASFVYDLSQFNGKTVVLCLGVYKGESETTENKLCLFNISMD